MDDLDRGKGGGGSCSNLFVNVFNLLVIGGRLWGTLGELRGQLQSLPLVSDPGKIRFEA